MAAGIRHPASGIRHPASGIRHPASGIRQRAAGSTGSQGRDGRRLYGAGGACLDNNGPNYSSDCPHYCGYNSVATRDIFKFRIKNEFHDKFPI
jgi:hypothetical protein